METLFKLAFDNLTGLAFGLVALYMMWKLFWKQIAINVEEQRAERAAHRADIVTLTEAFKDNVTRICDSNSVASANSCHVITDTISENHLILMETIKKHDIRVDEIVRLIKEFLNEKP